MKSVTFELEYLPVGFDAPFVYGIISGIYKRHGLDVKWRWGKGAGGTTKDAGAGNVDFGEGDATAALQLRAGGVGVKMIMGYIQRQTASIIFRDSAPIQTPKDLEGKTLGVTPGGGTTLLLPAFLQKTGLSKDALKIQNMSGSEKSLSLYNGKVDAILSVGIEVQPELAEKGVKTRVFNYADYGVDPLYLGLVTSDHVIQTEPDVVKAFVQASAEAVQEAQRHPDDTIQAVLSTSAATAPPESVLLQQLQAGIKFLATPNDAGKPFGWMAEQDWQATEGLAKQYLGYHGDVPLSEVYTNRFITAGG